MQTPTMKIRFHDGTEMQMSKTLLKRTSKYFIALFRSGMKETINNCLELHAMDTSSAKAVMNFLKYDKLQLDINNVVFILEASVYFEIPSLQEICFRYLSLHAVHYLDDIIKLSQLFNKTRLETLAFEGAAKNFQIAINCRYSYTLPQLRTLLASKYMTVSSEYDLVIHIVLCIHEQVKNAYQRQPVFMELMNYVSLSAMPLHCLLSLSNWPPVKRSDVLIQMIKETYLYHMRIMTILPLKCYLLPRRTKWNIYGCSEHIIEEVNLIWSTSDKSKDPTVQLNSYSGKGQIRELVWAFGFLYVFSVNGFLRFDPAWNRWVRLSGENEPLEHFTAVVFEDYIYKIGGQFGFDVSSGAERFSPRRNAWCYIRPLKIPLCASSAVVYEGHLVISGGLTHKMEFSRGVYTFDSVKNRWRSLAPMNFGRYGHQSVVFRKRVYVFGGTISEVRLDEISEVFNSATNQWTLLRFDCRFHFSYVWRVDEYLFAIEGFQTSRRPNLARVDVKTNRIIKYEEPLPFSQEADIKYIIGREA